MSSKLILGTLLVLGSAGVASAAFSRGLLVAPSGGIASSNNPLLASFLGLSAPSEFSVTGAFTFDPGSTERTVTYSIFQQTTLAGGSYETSSYLSANFTDNGTSGYVKDFYLTTELFSDTPPASGIAGSIVTAGQTGLSSGFCSFPSCTTLTYGPVTSAAFTEPAGSYYLEQTFTMTVSGVGPSDVITVDLPGTSGIGATPEPGYWAVLALGIAGLLVARRRFQKTAVGN